MLCQTDFLSWKNPEMGHVVEFLHFSDEESGTRRGCVLLEDRQLVRSGPEPMSSDSQHDPPPQSGIPYRVLAGKTETAVDKMYTMSSSWAQDSLCLSAPWHPWGCDWVLDNRVWTWVLKSLLRSFAFSLCLLTGWPMHRAQGKTPGPLGLQRWEMFLNDYWQGTLLTTVNSGRERNLCGGKPLRFKNYLT